MEISCKLDTILQDYIRAKRGGEEQKATDLITEVQTIVLARNLTNDLNIPVDAGIEAIADNAERLYDYICEVRDVIIKDGLHIFGQPPVDERFLEMIYALTRLENGKNPSLRESVAETFDLSLQDLLDNPSGFHEHHGLTNRLLLT